MSRWADKPLTPAEIIEALAACPDKLTVRTEREFMTVTELAKQGSFEIPHIENIGSAWSWEIGLKWLDRQRPLELPEPEPRLELVADGSGQLSFL